MTHDTPHDGQATHALVSPMAFARGGFIVGLALSIAGNVADARHSVLAMIIGGVWPLLLMFAFEILVRTVWPSGRFWRWPPVAGLVAVAAVAGFMSYRHLMSLLGRIGEDTYGAAAGPIAFDGLMVISAWAMLAIARAKAQETTAREAAAKTPRAHETARKPRKAPARPKTPPPARPEPSRPLAAVPAPPSADELPQWAMSAADAVLADTGKINGHLWQQRLRQSGVPCSNQMRERMWPAVRAYMQTIKEASA